MFLPVLVNLGEAFQQYFEIVPALSDTLKDHVYRIRHQVYCEELAYESPRPDRRERDEHDAHSLHLLIRSLRSGEFIGCTRIIRPRPQDPHQALPFERICVATLDRSVVDPAKLSRDTVAEVSRFAVIAQFRKRNGGEKGPLVISNKDFGTPAHPRFPYIPVGLCLGTAELARLNGIDTVFVLTKERMANQFRKLGADFQTIGTAVEYHGQRVPSMVSIHDIIKNLRPSFRPLYGTIAAQVARRR